MPGGPPGGWALEGDADVAGGGGAFLVVAGAVTWLRLRWRGPRRRSTGVPAVVHAVVGEPGRAPTYTCFVAAAPHGAYDLGALLFAGGPRELTVTADAEVRAGAARARAAAAAAARHDTGSPGMRARAHARTQAVEGSPFCVIVTPGACARLRDGRCVPGAHSRCRVARHRFWRRGQARCRSSGRSATFPARCGAVRRRRCLLTFATPGATRAPSTATA